MLAAFGVVAFEDWFFFVLKLEEFRSIVATRVLTFDDSALDVVGFCTSSDDALALEVSIFDVLASDASGFVVASEWSGILFIPNQIMIMSLKMPRGIACMKSTGHESMTFRCKSDLRI